MASTKCWGGVGSVVTVVEGRGMVEGRLGVVSTRKFQSYDELLADPSRGCS